MDRQTDEYRDGQVDIQTDQWVQRQKNEWMGKMTDICAVSN